MQLNNFWGIKKAPTMIVGAVLMGAGVVGLARCYGYYPAQHLPKQKGVFGLSRCYIATAVQHQGKEVLCHLVAGKLGLVFVSNKKLIGNTG